MDSIGTIASVVAALVCIITLYYTITNSKGYIRKRIEKNQRRLQELDTQFAKLYGLNANIGNNHAFYKRKERFERNISELTKRL